MMMLSMRLEIHDGECRRCGLPKPSADPCVQCALEDAEVHALRGESAIRRSREIDAERDQRREENGR